MNAGRVGFVMFDQLTSQNTYSQCRGFGRPQHQGLLPFFEDLRVRVVRTAETCKALVFIRRVRADLIKHAVVSL